MSTNLIKDLEDFSHEMEKYDDRQKVHTTPTIPPVEIRELRVALIEEEVQELITAMYAQTRENLIPEQFVSDMADIADGIADSIVVLIGTALAYGIPLQRVWDEVHRTNMAKLTMICGCTIASGISSEDCLACNGKGYVPRTDIKKRADGKILKPEGWQPPQIERIIQDVSNQAS